MFWKHPFKNGSRKLLDLNTLTSAIGRLHLTTVFAKRCLIKPNPEDVRQGTEFI